MIPHSASFPPPPAPPGFKTRRAAAALAAVAALSEGAVTYFPTFAVSSAW